MSLIDSEIFIPILKLSTPIIITLFIPFTGIPTILVPTFYPNLALLNVTYNLFPHRKLNNIIIIRMQDLKKLTELAAEVEALIIITNL